MPHASAPLTVQLRWALDRDRDFDDVMAIEHATGRPPMRRGTLMKLRCGPDAVTPGLADYRGRIVGYVLYDLAVADRIRLLRFAVHPDYHRRGVGRQVMTRMIGKLSRDRPRLAITVRDSNLHGQLFLRACGFKAAVPAISHDYWQCPLEDACHMVYSRDDAKSDTVSDARKIIAFEDAKRKDEEWASQASIWGRARRRRMNDVGP